LADCTFETWAPYPFVKRNCRDARRVLQVRVYGISPRAGHTRAWKRQFRRGQLSPIVVAAYALDGATPRMLHVCPYADLGERTRIRGEAVATGIWPPRVGPLG
jgi:hypothetical protein